MKIPNCHDGTLVSVKTKGRDMILRIELNTRRLAKKPMLEIRLFGCKKSSLKLGEINNVIYLDKRLLIDFHHNAVTLEFDRIEFERQPYSYAELRGYFEYYFNECMQFEENRKRFSIYQDSIGKKASAKKALADVEKILY